MKKKVLLQIAFLCLSFSATAQIVGIEKLEKCHDDGAGTLTSFIEYRTVYNSNNNQTFLILRETPTGSLYTLPGGGTVTHGLCGSGSIGSDTILINTVQFDSITILLDSLISVQTTTNNYLGDSTLTTRDTNLVNFLDTTTLNISLPASAVVDTFRKEIIEECLDYINGAGDTTKVWAYVNYSTIDGHIIDSGYIDQATLLNVNLDTTCNPTISIDTSVVECIYTIDLVNRFDTTQQTIDFDINQNETMLNKYGRFIVRDCDGNVLLDEIQNRQTTIYMGMNNTTALTTNGFIDSIRVIATDSSQIWIPLTSVTADLSGPGGTVTAGDLIYTGSDATYDAAITAAIINYLDQIGYTEITHYVLDVLVSTGTVTIRFTPKHDPTGIWLGLDANNREIQYDTDGSTPTTTTGSSNGTSGGPFNREYEIPCGDTISLRTNSLVPGEIDFTQTDFDTIVHHDPPITYTLNNSFTDLQDTCQETRLTANVTGCFNTPTYSWSTGDSTQTILWDSITVNTVTVDCECYSIQPCCISLCDGSVIATTGSSSATSDTLCTKIQNITTYEYINGTNTIEILADNYWSYSFTVIEGSIDVMHDGITSPFTFSAGFSDSKTAYGCDYIKKGIIITGQTASTKVLITKIE